MQAQKLYKQLIETEEKSRYLVLAKVFKEVFGRKIRRNEWGFLRKLVNLYGSESVFWGIMSSINISSEGTPLKYVATVCRNTTKEDLEDSPIAMSHELHDLLEYMRNYRQPDWEKLDD